ncbi:cerebellar degeneration-related protein 2 isoform X2 [Scophthalmus maximus]|uniref:cerebellar degeneration-related protein 2 isoform X2 n=1 Tax=Scophthalmus maximus TaxID=52904 RepID=UPI0015E0E516|nr:cerebellar degeneration-related protein 2 isoform X2 [Scophthalmus maximus]
MLTDMILEEEFDKSAESWHHPQDLEHDLHLAAELGKTLLDRNHELEQALQQMYSTNQEQLQEIEYLAKQVDLLRQMNDQHAKMYEQLDSAARDLEQGNRRLVQDNRLAQQRIHSLTETVDGLQTNMDELQTQVDELKASQAERKKRELSEQRRNLGAQSVSCLKELYDLHHDRHLSHDALRVDGLWSPQGSFYGRDRGQDPEEENASLQRSVQTLQVQIAVERSRREAAERESEMTASENEGLEQRLSLLSGCWARQKELEAEVEQLRHLWRADCAKRPDQLLLPETVFFASEEKPSLVQSDMEEKVENEEQGRYRRQRCNSDSVLRASNPDEIRRGHEQLCVRRAEAVKQKGISLLNEVDAQYSALQVKYDELLQRCHQATDGLSHKAVQTSHCPPASNRTRRRRSSTALSDLTLVLEDGQQPEYKALFKEIFTCIQKTKEDLGENSCADRDTTSHSSAH